MVAILIRLVLTFILENQNAYLLTYHYFINQKSLFYWGIPKAIPGKSLKSDRVFVYLASKEKKIDLLS